MEPIKVEDALFLLIESIEFKTPYNYLNSENIEAFDMKVRFLKWGKKE